MIQDDDDFEPGDDEISLLAELTEEITSRLESGEPLEGLNGVHKSVDCPGQIAQLLPTLRTLVSLGEQTAREDASRIRSRNKGRGKTS
jgi:hypothetical protein